MTNHLQPRLRKRLLQASALSLLATCLAGAAQAQSGVEQLSARLAQDGAIASSDRFGFSGLNLDRDGLSGIGIAPLNYTPPRVGVESRPTPGYVEGGRIGDPDSWKTAEFNLNYGLGQINAHHAYARGLTGKGVKAGVLDSGTDVAHSEFAGRNIQAIQMADVLANGSTCAPTRRMDGCFYTRGDQGSRIIAQAQLVAGGFASFSQKSGHGTHVAGLLGGNRDNNGNHGVAFGADIATSSIFADAYISGMFATFWVLYLGTCTIELDPNCLRPEANDGAWRNMYRDHIAAGVKVMNNSYGYSVTARTPAQLDAVYLANKAFLDGVFARTTAANAAGMIQVFSAGNDRGAQANFMAALPRWVPEAEPYWISVANVRATGVIDPTSSICGTTAQWCVSAPGHQQWSAQYGVSQIIEAENSQTLFRLIRDANGRTVGYEVLDGVQNRFNGFQPYTGTSMSAPHVTGAMTLLFERYPYLQGTFVRDILLTTARDLGAPGVDPIYGWGLVDLQKAIDGPGQLIKDSTVNMTSRAGGTKVWQGDAWDDWKNDISGVGRLTKTGPGWLRLSGTNTFNGVNLQSGILELTGTNTLASRVEVTGGTLMVGGRLANTPLNILTGGSAVVTGTVAGGLTTVGTGGSLSGTGTVGDTVVNGSITPGLSVNDMGRLTVAGNYTQNPGSVFNVAVRPVGQSGLLSVLGTATVTGGTMNVLALPGLYQLDQRYRVLNATGGLTGRFSQLTTSGLDLPFLAFGLNYDVRGVDLKIDRGVSFTSVAQTANQKAVAGSVDGMANSSSVLNAMSQLTLPQAQTALTETSGEAYAGLQGALMDSGRSVREAAIGRHLFGETRGERGLSFWIDARRANGERDATGGYAKVEQESDVYLMGADIGLKDGLSVGGFAGWGQTQATTTRAARARADNAHVGVYGSGTVSSLRLSAGAVLSVHETEVERSVTVSGLAQRLKSDSDYQTAQVYLDAGVDLPVSNAVFQPFAQYVRVQGSHDGLRETGGSLALSGTVNDTDLDVATVGVRFISGGEAREGGLPEWLKVRGSAGYRLIGGDRMPNAALALPTGGTFTVGSAPIGTRAFVTEVAASAQIKPNARLEAAYSGQLSDRGNDHTGGVRLVLSF